MNDNVVNVNSEQVVSLNSSVMLDVSEYKVLHVEHGVKTHAIFYIESFFVIWSCKLRFKPNVMQLKFKK